MKVVASILASSALLIAIGFAVQGAQSPKATMQNVSEGLTCQCGCGLTVANCNMPTCGFAVPMRKEIEGYLAKGMSRAEILAIFRHKYGEKILSAPTTEGFNLLAWITPFAAILIGGALVLVTVGRWRAHTSEGPAPEPPVGRLDASLRRRLDQEVREQL